MASLKDIRGRIASVKNIRKITRAMEMIAAARLRRAEQRIEHLRPYADALRRMTSRASQAAENIPNLPILQEREQVSRVGHPARDRRPRPGRPVQLADHPRRQPARRASCGPRARRCSGTPRAAAASRRSSSASSSWAAAGPGFTDRPAFADARAIADGLAAAYVDGKVDRVEIFYNGYISRGEPGGAPRDAAAAAAGRRARRTRTRSDDDDPHSRALWIYEPDPEEILARLVPDYVEISIYRALLESTASEHGARMSAMRSASDNAGELIDDLTLEANRQRQAEITQEIMEVVAGAEGLR